MAYGQTNIGEERKQPTANISQSTFESSFQPLTWSLASMMSARLLSSNSFATSVFPEKAAQCSGDLPLWQSQSNHSKQILKIGIFCFTWSLASMSAPNSINFSTTSSCPQNAAECRGVLRSCAAAQSQLKIFNFLFQVALHRPSFDQSANLQVKIESNDLCSLAHQC